MCRVSAELRSAGILDFEMAAGSWALDHPPRVIAVVCSTWPLHLRDYFNGIEQIFTCSANTLAKLSSSYNDTDDSASNQTPAERRGAILNAVCARLAFIQVYGALLFAAHGLSIRATIMVGRPKQVDSCHYASRLASAFNHRFGNQV